jgi:hypothetical protein
LTIVRNSFFSHGARNDEQVEAALQAWICERLAPYLPAYPDFLARVMSQDPQALASPFRAGLIRWTRDYRAEQGTQLRLH